MKNKKINLIKYIKNSNINDIKENILYYFYNDKLCENNIGSGYYGEIIKPNISKYMKIKTLLKTKIKVPIVVKKFKKNNTTTIITDYRRIINAFMNIPDNSVKIRDFILNNNDNLIKKYFNIFMGYGWISNDYPYSDKINLIIKDFLDLLEKARYITDLSTIPVFNKLLLEKMIKHNLMTTKRPNNDEIINISPYIIDDD
jgi:hypothetical protein